MNTGRNITAILAVVFLAGCALQEGGGAGGINDGKADGWDGDSNEAVLIDGSGDGQTFDVRQGQLVVVRLPSNPSTGYNWEVLSTDRTFGYPGEVSYIPDEPIVDGSGGITELVWQTDSVFSMGGRHTVVLGNVRSWEMAGDDAVEPDETFIFTVSIVAGRECPRVMCTLFCENGFEVDEDGCEICVCAEAPECEPVWCDLGCDFGYAVDEDGCEICECADCPNPVHGHVHYVAHSVEECRVVVYECLDGQAPFDSPCGCGCIEVF